MLKKIIFRAILAAILIGGAWRGYTFIRDLPKSQQQIATTTNTARFKTTVPLLSLVGKWSSDNPQLAGGTTSWTNGECPVVLLAVRGHRNCVLRALVKRRARDQHDGTVRLQDVASQFL